MKTVKLFSLLLVFATLSFAPMSVSADNGDDPEVLSTLRSKITKYVADPNLGEHGISKAEIKLKFFVNEDKEIVVLSTGTNYKYLDAFVKDRLNYRKAGDETLDKGIYHMKITFKAD